MDLDAEQPTAPRRSFAGFHEWRRRWQQRAIQRDIARREAPSLRDKMAEWNRLRGHSNAGDGGAAMWSAAGGSDGGGGGCG